MIPKVYKGKIYGAVLTVAEQKAMDIEINRQLIKRDEQYAADIDALYLYALMKHKGWKRKRLRNFWEDFVALHKELREFYQLNEAGDAEWFAHRELRKIGVDIHQWYKEDAQDE